MNPAPSTDPRIKVTAVVCASILAVVVDSPLLLAGLAVASVLALTRAGLAPRRLGWILLLGASLVWSTLLGQSLFYSNTPATPWWILILPQPWMGMDFPGLILWKEGFQHGAIQSFRFLGLTFAGMALALSTPVERLLYTLRQAGVPYGLAFMAATALRFVPVVAQEAWTVRTARRERGRAMWTMSPWRWMGEEVTLLRPIIGACVRRARVLAEVLDLRGFDPLKPRLPLEPPPLTRIQKTIITAMAAGTGVLVVLKILWLLYLAELWYRPEWRPLYAWVREWL